MSGFTTDMVVATWVGGFLVVGGIVGVGYLMGSSSTTPTAMPAKVEPYRFACNHDLLFSESEKGELKQILDKDGHGVPCKEGP